VGSEATVRAGHYFLGVEGLAVLRAFPFDAAQLEQRASEAARILSSMAEPPQSFPLRFTRHDVEAGYARWASRYDGPNPAIETEEPIFRSLVAKAGGPGLAVDAACGTGRHAALLADAGWRVVGVDATPAMLDQVLRPGGQLITTDMHPLLTSTGSMAFFPSGEAGVTYDYVPNLVHDVSAYVTAMVSAGLTIVGCHEPKVTEDLLISFPSYTALPEATSQAFLGLPYLLIWHAAKPG
jgi:hypothetical protein